MLIGVLVNNNNMNRGIDDLHDLLRAEIRASHAENLAEIRASHAGDLAAIARLEQRMEQRMDGLDSAWSGSKAASSA